MKITPGTRYTKNGVSIDVHEIRDGEAYCRKWPAGVKQMPFLRGLLRVPIGKASEELKDATVEGVAE